MAARYPRRADPRSGTGGAGTARRAGRTGWPGGGALTRGSCHTISVAGEPGESG